ncbi:MAG: phenylalanine--tRNA ligase subunit beta [Chitinophagales bacterium]
MKVSYNWIKDYLNIDMPVEKVGEILTDTGLEVEGIEKIQSIEGGLEGLVVGLVKTAEQHPNADRLRVTTVDVGAGEDLQIVCGAPNVAAGQKVIVATVGTKLYPTSGEPFSIKKGKIRGQVSMGMICAEDEIGIGTDHDGIVVLAEDTPVGKAAKEVYELEDDYMIEIGLTPNRSDAIGHVGVAKDLAAALTIHHGFTGTVQTPDVSAFAVDNHDLEIPVRVENTEACPRYAGVSIKGVTIKESPEWLQNRLKAIGVRPISNIVDITNFVLHELGQPLHAFDADKIKGGKVVVKTLAQDSLFLSLDEQERKLHEEDLMICNAESEGMCIAGVFGGLHSGVSDTTTNIFLESACFHPIRTRRTATRHNLRTDAAQRFEKGVDPNNTVYALKRAALLIKELGGGEIASDIVDVYPSKVKRAEIVLTYRNLNRLVGIEIPRDTVKQILTALEIEVVAETDKALTVRVGTNRADVLREADVIEEVLRIYGFNNVPIPTTLNYSLIFSEGLRPDEIRNLVSDYLASIGLNEMMGTSITNSSYYDEEDKGLVKLMNSLNANLDVMRKNMLFSGLEAISNNQNYQNDSLRLFEFGKTYFTYVKEDGNRYGENDHLTVFIAGETIEENWRTAKTQSSFFDLKDLVNNLLARLGITRFQKQYIESEHFGYGLQYKQGKRGLVDFGLVHPKISKKLGVKGEVFYADFNWNNVFEALKSTKLYVKNLPKYPSSRRDLALLVDKEVQFGQIEQIALKTGKNVLSSVGLFDIYADETKLGKGKKSYAVSFVFQDERKTMTDKEIDKIMKKMINQYERQLGASLR